MRIAALAFGVVAGLVASLILALGGLDASALAGSDPRRQLSLIRFGLFVIANFGVLGAGVVLAAPLAGTILFVLGAMAWLGAALLLRHGPDYVMLVPPTLLLVAAAFGAVAFIRRPAPDYDYDNDRQAVAAQRAAMAAAREDEEPAEIEAETRAGVAVGASFFGDGGTATPMRGTMPPRQSEPSMRRRPDDDDWQPVRRRTEPPRQRPMFRPPEDEEDDDEPGFWRVSRITSSILSFGLYGGLVAAALLVFLTLRTAESRPAAAKIEASTPGKASSAPRVAAAPVLPSSSAHSETAAAAPAPALVAPSTVLPPASFAPPAPSVAEASNVALPELSSSAEASGTAPGTDAASAAPSADQTADDTAPTSPASEAAPIPLEMSPQMAAARSRPATRRATPQAAVSAPGGDTGL